jgi:pimeloyl-ACP methyl ester carboxylesterase
MRRTAAMSRRELLATAAAAPLASLAGPVPPEMPGASHTFVLLHGAWHGGWCWAKLAPLLRAQGHTVFTPTLTGLGERAHLLSASVDLETHLKDVVALFEYEDLDQVILVGHSYGGMVIAGVAGRLASRIARLVYLDAFLPDDGKALKDYAPVPPTRADGWRVPPPGPATSWGVSNASDIRWMERRLGDQPLATFTQPLPASSVRVPDSAQAFIQCTQAPFFAEAARRARARGFESHELLVGGHDAMISAPDALAALLHALAG